MDTRIICLQWRGPYSLDEILASERGNGLYLLAGKLRYGRKSQIQYCGITQGLYHDRLKRHHKLALIKRDLCVWLLEVVYPPQHTRIDLEVTESILVSLCKPPLNERKTTFPPRPFPPGTRAHRFIADDEGAPWCALLKPPAALA